MGTSGEVGKQLREQAAGARFGNRYGFVLLYQDPVYLRGYLCHNRHIIGLLCGVDKISFYGILN